MDRPWLKLFTRDWLDDTELRKCSLMARATLIDLMCLAHEGVPYGYLAGKTGQLPEKQLAFRCALSLAKFKSCVSELDAHGRLHRTTDGILYISRMVRDEEVRMKRAAGGAKSTDNPNVPHKGTPIDDGEGYPSLKIHSRARAGADRLPSDSDSSFSGRGVGEGQPVDDDLSQIKRWLYEFMGEGWPEPDLLVCEQVYVSMNGAPLEKLALFLRQLHNQGKRPQKSWAWFIGVVREYFGRRSSAN